MSCQYPHFYGCNGGIAANAWAYWVSDGIVTGGQYKDTTHWCKPYPFEPCKHHGNGDDSLPICEKLPSYETPDCVAKCQDSYKNSYESDKIKGLDSYSITGIQNIQREIMTKGPVEATFNVWKDWLVYKSGVYRRQWAVVLLGLHAIKIIGWGVENGDPYWLCANSWNNTWGDKGFFKILRGSNECEIERNVVAGTAPTL